MSTTTVRSWGIGITAVIATAAGIHLSEGRAESHSVDLPNRTTWMRTHCPAEDSIDCAWNGHVDGNGHGASFYAVESPLFSERGRRMGRVVCHYLVNTRRHPNLDRFDSCQISHRRSTTTRTPAATMLDGLQWILNGGE